MNIFEYDNYKQFVLEKVKQSPNRGHGQYSKIAKKLNIHTSLVSQIFQGPKQLSFEQACDLGAYYQLTELEADYLIALVMKERAGTLTAKNKCQRDLNKIKEKANKISERISTDVVLSDFENATFFSHWHYAATKLMISLPAMTTSEQIAKGLNLPLSKINQVLEFLIQSGLCIYKDQKYGQGPMKMQLPSDSPFVSRHHLNWHIKAIERIGSFSEKEFCFSMPANLSIKDAEKLRQHWIHSIEEAVKTVDQSSPENMYCLNLDWFRIDKIDKPE